MNKRSRIRWNRAICAFILALIMTSSPGVTFGMQKGSNLASDFYTGNPSLHPDDAKVRDFERWLPTQYNPWNYYIWPMARKDFNGKRPLFWAAGLSLLERRGKIIQTQEQSNVLRVKYPANKYGSANSGASFPWILKKEYEELSLRYRIMFQDGFEFTTSGKLPGLCGTTDTIGCFRYTGGNKPNGDEGFSVRVVWLNGDGTLGSYVYHANQQGKYGVIFVWEHKDGQPVHINPGEWHTIQLRVRLNDPGKANGEVEAWFDGERVSFANNLLFRNDSENGRRIKINEMYFSSFHGGNKQKDAPSQTQYTYFDDFELNLCDTPPKPVKTPIPNI